MVPGGFDFVFVTVILVIGFEFGCMPLLPVFLSLIGKQAENLVCVCVFSPQTEHLSPHGCFSLELHRSSW